MPELPEVETHVRDLQPLVGAMLRDVSTTVPKAWSPSFARVRDGLFGRQIRAITRRAKYILFDFGDVILVVHFRMTGHFLRRAINDPLERCVRHRFTLTQGRTTIDLRLEDTRKFGTLALVLTQDIAAHFSRLGPEPLARDFTLAACRERLTRKGTLKAVLLNQSVIAGIGNIYADEICFAARLHPASRIESLKPIDLVRLHAAIVSELQKGVVNRGTTIGEFLNLDGVSGANQNTLRAYGRGGEPCVVCGALLDVTKIAQRTTTFCPRCQPRR